MAITATHRTSSGSITDANSYVTASITPTNGSLLVIFIAERDDIGGGVQTVSSVTSTHGTWVDQINITAPGGLSRLSCFTCQSNGNTGAITINLPTVFLAIAWSVSEYNGHNVDAPVVQGKTAYGTSTTPAVTMDTFENSANATIAGVGWVHNSATCSAGTGFTELGESGVFESRNAEQEWRNDNDTTVDATLSASSEWYIIGLELRDASVPAPVGGAFFAFM